MLYLPISLHRAYVLLENKAANLPILINPFTSQTDIQMLETV